MPTVMSQRADSGSHLKWRDMGGVADCSPHCLTWVTLLVLLCLLLKRVVSGGIGSSSLRLLKSVEAIKDNGTTVACVARTPVLLPVPAGGPLASFLSEFREAQYSLVPEQAAGYGGTLFHLLVLWPLLSLTHEPGLGVVRTTMAARMFHHHGIFPCHICSLLPCPIVILSSCYKQLHQPCLLSG